MRGGRPALGSPTSILVPEDQLHPRSRQHTVREAGRAIATGGRRHVGADSDG